MKLPTIPRVNCAYGGMIPLPTSRSYYEAVGEELVNPEDKKVYVINIPRSDTETVVVIQGVTQVLPAGVDGAILKEDSQQVMKL